MRNYPSIAVTHPELVDQWHPDNGIPPTQVSAGSNRKFLWRCRSGHVWAVSPNSRIKSGGRVNGCAVCSGRSVLAGFNDLATTHPDLALEWSDKNTVPATAVTFGSQKKFIWDGRCGHSWDAVVASRTRNGDGCPFCSGHRVLAGFNDLGTVNPDLALEWHPANTKSPSEVSAGSAYLARWRCVAAGHEWTARVTARSRGRGCPVCAGKLALPGVNDLATTSPGVALLWDDPTRSPAEVTAGSNYVARWKCPEQHQWSEQVFERTSSANPSQCPVCTGSRIVSGVNDFATLFPKLAAEWVEAEKPPNVISPGSVLSVQWKCSAGHRWSAPVNRRVAGFGCPYCSGQRAITGSNDLATTHPELASEWSPRNTTTASSVMAGSSRRFWWVCGEGHEWYVSPNSRTGSKAITGCPDCCTRSTSRKELDVLALVESAVPAGVEVINRFRDGRFELDVYVPGLSVAVEFHGLVWHSEKFKTKPTAHADKAAECRRRGIRLIQIWEDSWDERRDAVVCLLRNVLLPKRLSSGFSLVDDSREAAEFLDAYHLRGSADGGFGAVLIERGTVVAAVSATRQKYGSRLERYASIDPIHGGFEALANWLVGVTAAAGGRAITTMSDHELSNGEHLLRCGFRAAREFSPRYTLLHRGKRVDASSLHLAGPSPSTHRIWDSGHTLWKLPLTTVPDPCDSEDRE